MAQSAPHLTKYELSNMRIWQGSRERLSPIAIWKMHKADREKRNVRPLCLTAMRKLLRGRSYNAVTETRGRKRALSPRALEALNKKRREVVMKSEGQREISWSECIQKARIKKVHTSTAKRSLVRAGVPVASRRPREKPDGDPRTQG